MEKKEFKEYLESIGGLENGYFTDIEPIKDVEFFSIRKGWFKLTKELIDELIEDGWDKKICQVKEKFGGLRFYTNGGGDNHHQIISKYEKISYETCEVCGEKGEPRGGGWITTLCSEHYIEPIFNKFETKNDLGFTQEDFKELLEKFPKINIKKVDEAMFCNTCGVIDGEIIYYPHDVRSAIYCGVENRDQIIDEWD